VAELAQARSRLTRWCALLVAVVAFGQVRNVAEFDFVEFDDDINIVFNQHLGPVSRDTVVWAFSDLEHMRRYVPVGWMGFALVYGFSGLTPSGYHVAGAAVHIVSAMLVFLILLTVLRRFAGTVEDRWRLGCATLAALAWALHPMRAETIGWASGLFYGLAGVLAFLSLLAYLRAWSPGARRGRWIAAAGLLHLGAMLAYPMTVGVFGVFVLLDVAFRRVAAPVAWRRLVLEKLALAVPVMGVAALTVMASHNASEFWARPPSWAEFGAWARLQQAGAAWVYFLWKPWWPVGLTPVPTWLVDPAAVRLQATLSLIAVGGVTLGLLVGWRRWSGVAVLWLAHSCLLAPMLGLAERPYFPADRYHQLPAVVLVAGVALMLVRLRGPWRIGAVVAAGVVLAALATGQQAQLRIWADTDTLMRHIVHHAEHPAVRRDYQERWIRFHGNRGRVDQATALAAELGVDQPGLLEPMPRGVPPTAALHMKLALAFVRGGRPTEAHEHFEATLKLVPDWGEAAYNWGLLYASQGAALEALARYRRAAAPGRGKPVEPIAQVRLLALIADAFYLTGRVPQARETIELALATANGAGLEPGLTAQLQAQRARYGSVP
jgi:hypothetical protein